MKSGLCRTMAVVALCFTLAGAGQAFACSWASFAAGTAAVVARTVDWYSNDGAAAMGVGRGIKVKAADTPNALEYTTKYASIQLKCFGFLGGEGMNEAGLQASMLFLDDSLLPPADPNRKDVKPLEFIPYALGNFATVQELVDSLPNINLLPSKLPLPNADGQPLRYREDKFPCHFAFSDLKGDRAIVEFVGGKLMLYHGKEYDAMTNEPDMVAQLTFEKFGLQPNGGIGTIDRRMRAKHYLRDMYERGVDSTPRALLAMRGLLATVWAGTEEIDRAAMEVYPTIWGCLADQVNKRYYLQRVFSMCTEIYDFSMFDTSQPEIVPLPAPGCRYPDIDSSGVL